MNTRTKVVVAVFFLLFLAQLDGRTETARAKWPPDDPPPPLLPPPRP